MTEATSVPDRYTTVAIWLHWIIATFVLVNIALGFGHELVVRSVSQQMMWFHKSIGLTVLLLTLGRLGWRLVNPRPRMPDHMAMWERWTARLTHWAFYLLMLALPLAGWAMSSASPRNAPIPFWGLTFPMIPGFTDMAESSRKALTHQYGEWHEQLAWIAIALIVLHVAAALKHQFWDKDAVVHRMLPIVKPGRDI